jgi:hypothetical protein
MVFDLSNVVQYIFVASIAAAGLMYAAGNVLIESLSRAIQNTEKECDIITSPNTRPNYNKKAEMLLSYLKSVQKWIIPIFTLDIGIFLFCNFLIMLYWIFNGNLFFTSNLYLIFTGILYLIGIFLMIVTIVNTPKLLGEILKISVSSNDS